MSVLLLAVVVERAVMSGGKQPNSVGPACPECGTQPAPKQRLQLGGQWCMFAWATVHGAWWPCGAKHVLHWVVSTVECSTDNQQWAEGLPCGPLANPSTGGQLYSPWE